jgi:TIGR02436 family protein
MTSIAGEKSFAFAVRIVRLYQHLVQTRKEYVLSKQVLRCGTSIGANIREALHGQSRKDFHAKMYIALKECSETLYWLELLTATNYLTQIESDSIIQDAKELHRILQSITKTTKE